MKKAIAAASLLAAVVTITAIAASRGDAWTPEQLDELRSLSLAQLGPLPADPNNRVADDPRAVGLRAPAVLRHAPQLERKGLVRHVPHPKP